jgi:hypothetical protein
MRERAIGVARQAWQAKKPRWREDYFGDGIAETIGGAVSPILVKYRLKMILATLLVLLLVS